MGGVAGRGRGEQFDLGADRGAVGAGRMSVRSLMATTSPVAGVAGAPDGAEAAAAKACFENEAPDLASGFELPAHCAPCDRPLYA